MLQIPVQQIPQSPANLHMEMLQGKTGTDIRPMSISNHEFFEQSVSRLLDRLYGVAMRFTRNPADAEDLIAESLEKAWKKLDSLENREQFDGWLMRILSNTFISQWRRKKTHDKVIDDDVLVDDLDDTDSLYAKLHQPFLLWWGTPEQAFLNGLLKEEITKALDKLPDAYRIVVVMVQLLGCTYEEVAEELTVPIGTVRSRLNRGRKLLQDYLWHLAGDSEPETAV